MLSLSVRQHGTAADMAKRSAEEPSPGASAGPDDEREALLLAEPGTESTRHSNSAGSLGIEGGDGLPPAPTDKSISSPVSVDLIAQLSLLAVATIWGSYTPALRCGPQQSLQTTSDDTHCRAVLTRS